MTGLNTVVIVTKRGKPHLVFQSPKRAREYAATASGMAFGQPYQIEIFAIADAAAEPENWRDPDLPWAMRG